VTRLLEGLTFEGSEYDAGNQLVVDAEDEVIKLQQEIEELKKEIEGMKLANEQQQKEIEEFKEATIGGKGKAEV